MEYLCSTKTPAWDRTSGYKEKRSDRFRIISEKSVKTTPKSTRENCQCGSLSLVGVKTIEAQIDIKILTTFINIAMDTSTIEHQIALRQLLVKTDESSSWFIKVNHILHKYDLPEPEYLLQNIRSDRSKQYWKRVMKRHVDSFWHFQNQQEVNGKSTLSHFKLQENSARIPHQLWLGSKYSPSASRKAAIKANIVINTYRIQSNKAKFNKYEVNPICVMCDERDETLFSHARH